MPFDPTRDPLAVPLVSRPRRAPLALVLAGVAGAAALGGGLGLLARPSGDDVALLAQRAASAPVPMTQPRQIEIRVDRPLATVGAHDVVAAAPSPPVETAAPPEAVARPEPAPELLAPTRSPEGLVKVRATAPERLVDAEQISAGKARQAAARKARAEAEAARKAKAARALRAAEEREARAEALRKAKMEKARIAEAAEAKARAQAERKLAERKLAERKLAERKAAEQLATRKAAAEEREARLAVEKKAAARKLAERKLAEQKRKAAPKAVAASGPPTAKTVKVSTASSRCASPDPGAALACADASLGAAERQLARAYRQAEAAGVPPEKLERQQQRWLAARANAARQAPWAVHDIYLARIAELQDQTRAAARSD